MRMTNLFKLTVFGIVAIAAACSVSPELDREMEQRTKDTIELRQKAVAPAEQIPDDLIRVKNDIWLGDSSTIEYEGEAVPTYLEAKDGITLISNRPITLFEIGNMISKITGLTVRYAPELEQDDRTSISTADNNQPDIESLGQQWTDSTKMIVNYKGPLSGLLDEVSNRFGIWWKYEKNEVYFYKFITKTFILYTLPTTPTVDASITNSGGEGEDSVSAQNSYNATSVWDEVNATLETMKTSDGSISMNPGSGTINVTDTPTVIKRIGKYITDMNARMSKQVAISVKVLQVDINNEDGFNFDLGATIAQSNNLKTTSWTQSGALENSTSTLGMGILKGKVDLQATFNGLSKEGNAQIITSGSVTTMNNKAAPIKVMRKQSYIKEQSTTNNGSGDNNSMEIDVETEDINTGFMMAVLPRVLDHGRLMIYFNLTLSNLVSLEKIPLGSGTEDDAKDGFIQNPITEARGFTQELAMKSGETLVLAGFEQVKDQTEKIGTGKPDNMLLGGSSSADRSRTLLVIMLTPVVIESPLDPESRMRD